MNGSSQPNLHRVITKTIAANCKLDGTHPFYSLFILIHVWDHASVEFSVGCTALTVHGFQPQGHSWPVRHQNMEYARGHVVHHFQVLGPRRFMEIDGNQ